ncbi:hypothetical protein Y032_0010g1019 [Ancylostoma ceylanicum]|uniref:SCP domain-containing protein n=1 Tax=Ancylostoma ceylanicum TaxID=53326 RepID=A0A016VFL2_9BILA|nr:hypothetical protein Y032_0010g1019 [Ancylostoma ceylanicum]
MLRSILVLLCINELLSLTSGSVCSSDPQDADKIRTEVLKSHNAARKEIVSADGVQQSDGTKLPGSKNLFKITYDCLLEGFAMIAVQGCPNKLKTDSTPRDKAVNYAYKRGQTTAPADDAAYLDALKEAMAEWLDSRYEDNLDKNVTYKNEGMAPYANIIYNNTIAVGCSVFYCPRNKRIATACVYNAKPQLEKPLYTPAKTGTKCDPTKKQCAKAIKRAECQDDSDKETEGLCFIKRREVTREFPASVLQRRTVRHYSTLGSLKVSNFFSSKLCTSGLFEVLNTSFVLMLYRNPISIGLS